jgi:hypothetical protein
MSHSEYKMSHTPTPDDQQLRRYKHFDVVVPVTEKFTVRAFYAVQIKTLLCVR